jgi:iron complex outermembrane receptor protein
MLPSAASAEDAVGTPAPASTEDGGFGDIIVTANRREERNQDVPIAITAFSADRLDKQLISKEQDLQASVPSLVVGPNGQGSRESQSFTLRGQGATFQASPGVVVYLNEVPLPAPLTLSQQGGPGNFVDLDSMQVLAVWPQHHGRGRAARSQEADERLQWLGAGPRRQLRQSRDPGRGQRADH